MEDEFTKKEKKEFNKFRTLTYKFTNDFSAKSSLDPRAMPYILMEHAFFLFQLFDIDKKFILEMVKTASQEGNRMAKEAKKMHGLSDEE